MDFTSSRQVWAAVIGALAVLIGTIALFMHAPENNATQKHPAKITQAGLTPRVPVEKVLLPSGVERAMTQNIPLIGPVTGARWVSGHRFQVREEEKVKERGPHDIDQNTAPPMDVLVDADGYFIMARLNGETFATRSHAESLKKLLGNIRRWQGKNSLATDRPPAVKKVAFPKIAWDDPVLGQKITGKYFSGYLSDPTSFKTHLEESFTVLDVWLEGESVSRRILLARYTEGLAEPRVGEPQRFDADKPVVASNRHGAYVVTRIGLFQWEDGLQAPAMHLIEPWDGPCPWPLGQLDPECGDNLITEFMLPAEFDGHPTTIFDQGQMRERFAAMDRMREAAARRKDARLAASAPARGESK